MSAIPSLKSVAVAALASACAAGVHAAEDFRVRYNLVGTIGGEIFAPAPSPGWVGALAVTYVDGKKLTGDDGNDLTLMAPGGTVPLAPGGTALDPSYTANKVTLKSSGRATVGALALGYIQEEKIAGGRLVFSGVLPMAQTRTAITPVNSIPELNWPNPSMPNAGVKTGVAGQFATSYQANIQGLADERNGEVTGLGDLELSVGWLYAEGPWKVRAGTALVLPTGKYSASPGPDTGLGNFYTLRPEAQVTYLPSEKWAVSGKAVLGFNTRNRDNQLRSGDWYGLEAAAGYMTALGPVGLHAVHVKQYQDDKNNTLFGASRFQMNGMGAFMTTRIPVIDAVVTLQHMVTTSSKNARHSNFTQVRLVKRF
jgi:hypothetical protein